MFRAAVKALSEDGKDPISEMETAIEFNKHTIKKMPLSPVKKQVLTSFYDYWANQLKDVGFLNAVNKLEKQTQLLELQTALQRLVPLRDDDFILAVRGLAYSLPPKDSLRIALIQSVQTAENQLDQRRDFTHKAVGAVAAFVAVATFIRNPVAGLAVAAVEAAAVFLTDINTVLNNLLELYDSPYDIKIEPAASAEMAPGYRR